ncbi:MAG: YaaR family protein [Oscillospiraceae bacterium]|jgi:uncharacterized protein YaaR (DUF327 family)|nr:YaaR family protein [Oscillospiraceae bacterium]
MPNDITKIGSAQSGDAGAAGVRRTSGGSRPADTEKVFRATLGAAADSQRRENLEQLIGRIDEQGRKLSGTRDVAELERYRKLVSEFMNEIVSGGYEFNQESSFAARGRRRVISTVQTVNRELDELAKEVLSGQAEPLSILERTGEIRGMLVDMLV